MPMDMPPTPVADQVTTPPITQASLQTLHLQTAQLLGDNLAGIEIQGPVSQSMLTLLNRSNPELSQALARQGTSLGFVANSQFSPQVQQKMAKVLYGEFLDVLQSKGFIHATPALNIVPDISPGTQMIQGYQANSEIHFPLKVVPIFNARVLLPKTLDPVFLTWVTLAHEAAHTEQLNLKAPFQNPNWTPAQNAAMNDLFFTHRTYNKVEVEHFQEAFADVYGQLMMFKLFGSDPNSQKVLIQNFQVYVELRENTWATNLATFNVTHSPEENATTIEAHDHLALEWMKKALEKPDFWAWVQSATPAQLQTQASQWASLEWSQWLTSRPVEVLQYDVAHWGGPTDWQNKTFQYKTPAQIKRGQFVDAVVGHALNRLLAYRLEDEQGIPLKSDETERSPLERFMAKSDKVFAQSFMENVPAVERIAFENGENVSNLPALQAWLQSCLDWTTRHIPKSVVDANEQFMKERIDLVQSALTQSKTTDVPTQVTMDSVLARLQSQRNALKNGTVAPYNSVRNQGG